VAAFATFADLLSVDILKIISNFAKTDAVTALLISDNCAVLWPPVTFS